MCAHLAMPLVSDSGINPKNDDEVDMRGYLLTLRLGATLSMCVTRHLERQVPPLILIVR